jgi:hypothetical protein
MIPLASSHHKLYDKYLLLCIQYSTPDDGQKTCPKHVEFYSKNKCEKLVHLVGFIIRIYHDARSSEYQVYFNLCLLADSGKKILELGEDAIYCKA